MRLLTTTLLSLLTLTIHASPLHNALHTRQSTVPSGSGHISVVSEADSTPLGCLNSAGQFVPMGQKCGLFTAMPVNNAVSAFKTFKGVCHFVPGSDASYNYMCDDTSTSNLVGSSFAMYDGNLAVGDYRYIFNVATMPTKASPQYVSTSQPNNNPLVVKLTFG